MNKYQFRAVSTAILAILVSFTCWTIRVGSWSPSGLADTAGDSVRATLEKLFRDRAAPKPLAVRVVTVENLGDHFERSVQETRIRASVSHEARTVHTAAATPPVLPEEPAPADEPSPAESVPLATDELTQWELKRAWNIAVPSLGIRAPVLLPSMTHWSTQEWGLLEEQMQIGLQHGTVAYPHSVSPGRKGTLIIAGHSSPPDEAAEASAYGYVFARLPDVAVGQDIVVTSGSTEVVYRVEEKTVVSPKTTSILAQQNDASILKLITCFPVGTTRDRMIILARKAEDVASSQ